MNKVCAILILIFCLTSYTHAQNKQKAYVMSWDIDMYTEKPGPGFNFFFNLDENKHYTKAYKKRVEPALVKAFKEEEDIDFKLAPLSTYTPEEMGQLKSLKDKVIKEYYNSYIPSAKYKKQKYIRNQGSEYIENLNYFADKMKSDILTFIFLVGIVKEKQNKKGEWDEDAKGYITYLGVIVNANNGKIIEEFTETYPRNSVGSTVGNDVPRAVLTDNEIDKISRKFIKKLGRDYEKAVSNMEK